MIVVALPVGRDWVELRPVYDDPSSSHALYINGQKKTVTGTQKGKPLLSRTGHCFRDPGLELHVAAAKVRMKRTVEADRSSHRQM